MTTAKTILDNIMTRIGMYSAISNYFTSTEIHAQEVIRLLNALLKAISAKFGGSYCSSMDLGTI